MDDTWVEQEIAGCPVLIGAKTCEACGARIEPVCINHEYWGYPVECQEAEACAGTCTPGAREEETCNECGTRDRSCQKSFITGKYEWGLWSRCSVLNPMLECSTAGCDDAHRPDQTRPCGCNNKGKQTRSVVCQEVKFGNDEVAKVMWVTTPWSECVNAYESECMKDCSGIPEKERECSPGATKKDGTPMCSVRVSDVEVTLTPVDSNSNFEEPPITDSGESSGNTRTYSYTSVDYGYVCARNCRWVANACPSYGGGGGNSGSRPEYLAQTNANSEESTNIGGCTCDSVIGIEEIKDDMGRLQGVAVLCGGASPSVCML